MIEFPYYLTWGNQTNLGAFPVHSSEHDEFVLEDGRRVYDFLSTSFHVNFGHSCDVIRRPIHDQLDQMPVASPKASFALKRQVSERLLDLLNLTDGKLFYTTGGSESVENALKMSRQVRGANKVLARRNSYHGATLGALSVTGDWRNDPHMTLDSETVRIPEPQDDTDFSAALEIIKRHGAENFAAIILETISGVNGVVIPTQSWFDQVQKMCDETGILLILDEVLTGFGRTGPSFAYQLFDLSPDLVCLSKGITGGYIPFGAVWTGPKIVSFYEDCTMACGLTCYAHPLGLAALSGVLDLLSDSDFQQNKSELEERFSTSMMKLSSESCVDTMRTQGLLAAIEFSSQAPSWPTCFENGLHLYSKGNRIVLAPPLNTNQDRFDDALKTFTQLARDSAS